MYNLYEKINKLCRKHEISLSTMCQETGISLDTIEALNVGTISRMDNETLDNLAEYFYIYPEELLR